MVATRLLLARRDHKARHLARPPWGRAGFSRCRFDRLVIASHTLEPPGPCAGGSAMLPSAHIHRPIVPPEQV